MHLLRERRASGAGSSDGGDPIPPGRRSGCSRPPRLPAAPWGWPTRFPKPEVSVYPVGPPPAFPACLDGSCVRGHNGGRPPKQALVCTRSLGQGSAGCWPPAHTDPATSLQTGAPFVTPPSPRAARPKLLCPLVSVTSAETTSLVFPPAPSICFPMSQDRVTALLRNLLWLPAALPSSPDSSKGRFLQHSWFSPQPSCHPSSGLLLILPTYSSASAYSGKSALIPPSHPGAESGPRDRPVGVPSWHLPLRGRVSPGQHLMCLGPAWAP